jgi:ketosteroid isomerase-like protein
MNDEAAIEALLDRYEAAIRDKDAQSTIECLASNAVAYDLAPPLVIGPKALHDPSNIQQWFDTWKGPIHSVAQDMVVRSNGKLGFAYALRRMSGTKVDGEKVDLWFRATAALVKEDGAWKIEHLHNSVPFAMDGSDKALLDLKP